MTARIQFNQIRIVILVVFITGCCSFNFPQLDLNITADKGSHNLSQFINHIEEIASEEAEEVRANKAGSNETETAVLENLELPQDCSQREKEKKQPINDSNSHLKKCCAIGESINPLRKNQSAPLCDTTNLPFNPSIINAVLYDNCIEDSETEVSLPLEIGNPCNESILYNSVDDIFYVLQDGSLLIMDPNANESYTVERIYCIDIDNVSGISYAVTCQKPVEDHLKRGQIVTVSVLMLVSMPCLLFLGYLHLAVKELRTLHGLSLSLMSFSLASGYFLYSLAHIFQINASKCGYAVQFFVLSYIFWFFCLCCNVVLNIWYKIPLNKRFTKFLVFCNFSVYCLISFTGPLVLVILTVQKGFLGMPSYFIQGFTESIRDSQRYFIPPVSCMLFLSFVVMIVSFFGFQRIKKRGAETKEKDSNFYLRVNAEFDEEKYEEVKKDAKCISLLGIIMITTWLLETVTFYSPGPENYLILLEMINGIQGVLIMLIFLVVRRRRTIILRWWYDRGSHSLEEHTNIELTEINK